MLDREACSCDGPALHGCGFDTEFSKHLRKKLNWSKAVFESVNWSVNTHVVGQTRALIKRVSRIGLTPLYATLSLQTEPERWDLFSPLEIVHA
jgi:hypothetical protein